MFFVTGKPVLLIPLGPQSLEVKPKTPERTFQVLLEPIPSHFSSLACPDLAPCTLSQTHGRFPSPHDMTSSSNTGLFFCLLFPCSGMYFLFLSLAYLCLFIQQMFEHLSYGEEWQNILAKLYQKKNESRFNSLEAEAF